MRIVVIGRSGQLAQRLAAVQSPMERVFLNREEVDFARPEKIAVALRKTGADVIVNAAAYTAVDRAESDHKAAFTANAQGPGEAASVAAALGVPFVHVSTDYVYDGAKNGAYLETDPTGPLGVYGASKLAGEKLVRAACPRSTILRTAWVYAPEGNNFVKTMLRLGATGNALRVVADQRGSPTYAGDLAEAILAIASRLTVAPGGDPVFDIFHWAGGGETSWAGFAEAIVTRGAELGLIGAAPTITPITTAEFPTRARRPANSVLDCGKFTQVFGSAPRDWREALDAALTGHPSAFTPLY